MANLEAGPETSKISKIKTQPTTFNYVKRQSMAEIVARLCSLDGFSISGKFVHKGKFECPRVLVA